MRALALTHRPAPGALSDVLRMMDVAEPAPRSREVVIRVRASTINIDDIHMAEGTFYGGLPMSPRPSPGAPVVLGSDVAGEVVRIGSAVRAFQVGEPVFGVHLPFRRDGAWAEFCAVDERWITRKPEHITFEAAAACGISGLVAISAINALELNSGAQIVIVGVTGGIGSIAAQLAVRSGAHVIGVCGRRSFDRAYQLGCSVVLDYNEGAWDRFLRVRGIEAIDRVLDTVGGKDVELMARRILRREGRFVTVVGPRRFIGDHPLGWSGILSTLAYVGYRAAFSYLQGPRYILTGPGLASGKLVADVAEVASDGVLPFIDVVVPFQLEAMREALRRASSHQNKGRIVITMADH